MLASLSTIRYFENPTDGNKVYAYDSSQPADIPFINTAVADGWVEVTGHWPPPETVAQAQAMQIAGFKTELAAQLSEPPITIGANTYTLNIDQTNATINLAAVMSAQMALTAPAWAPNKAVTVGTLATLNGNSLFCSQAGTTGASAPTGTPTTANALIDGTAAWELFSRSVELIDGSYIWLTAQEIIEAGAQVELYVHQRKKSYSTAVAAVQAATTITAVQAVSMQ